VGHWDTEFPPSWTSKDASTKAISTAVEFTAATSAAIFAVIGIAGVLIQSPRVGVTHRVVGDVGIAVPGLGVGHVSTILAP
jgi:hypothetical protein